MINKYVVRTNLSNQTTVEIIIATIKGCLLDNGIPIDKIKYILNYIVDNLTVTAARYRFTATKVNYTYWVVNRYCSVLDLTNLDDDINVMCPLLVHWIQTISKTYSPNLFIYITKSFTSGELFSSRKRKHFHLTDDALEFLNRIDEEFGK